MRKFFSFCFSVCVFSLFNFFANAQGEVPVDIYTGRPIISVPLFTITDHEISGDVSMDYNASGIRVQQDNGYFGLGWGVSAGGSVTRQVRGLPDDFKGVSPDNRRGWLFTNASSVQNNYDVQGSSGTNYTSADTLMSTWTDEAADYSKLNGNGYLYDTEPDVFSYEFSGYSGKFVFDNTNSATPTIRFIPHTEVTATANFNATGQITGFVFRTNNGERYTFYQTNNDTRRTYNIASTVEFFKRDYLNYTTSASFTSQWNLQQAARNGSQITYSYTAQAGSSSDTVRVFIHNSTGTGYTVKDIYRNVRTSYGYRISTISANNAYVVFTYSGGLLTTITYTDQRNTAFSKVFNLAMNTAANGRTYLKSITEVSNSVSQPPYLFSYMNEASFTLPTKYSKAVDFWGYFNGNYGAGLMPTTYYSPSLSSKDQIRLFSYTSSGGPTYTASGADRRTTTLISSGTLNRIIYPSGGSTYITYEPHDFWDPLSNQNQLAGGLRVKSISFSDGVSSLSTVTKTFTYRDSAGVRSSGKLISMPKFAIPTYTYTSPTGAVDNTVTDWSKLFVNTEFDVTQGETTHGSTVGYEEVKVSRPTGGYVRFQYLLPGAYGVYDKNNWIPTKDRFARGLATTIKPITYGTAWQFPYAQNPTFDHERGLQWRKVEYSETNRPMRLTRTYYQPIFKATAAYPVYGVDYEYLPYSSGGTNVYFYAKYGLLTDVTKAVQLEKVTTYDTTSRKQTETTEMIYANTTHRLLAQSKHTTNNGTVYSTYYKYPLDYTVPAGSDTPSTMIGNLQTTRNNEVIETYSTITKPSEFEKVVAGSIRTFNQFSTSYIFPEKSMKLLLKAPVLLSPNFKPSYVDATTKTFKVDTSYEVSNTILAYETSGMPVSSVGPDRMRSATGWGYDTSVPIVSVSNADHTQMGFSDFDNVNALSFASYYGTFYYGAGRNSAQAVSPGVILTKTITKANVTNYVLSFWINSTADLSFTVELNGTPTNFTVPSSGGTGFKYYTRKFSVASLSGPTFTFSINVPSISEEGSSTPTLKPVIDDVAFYPESATVVSSTYLYPFGPATTTLRDITTSFTYDAMGRKTKVIDNDNNILQRKTYTNQLGAAFAPIICAAGAKKIQYDGISYTTIEEFFCNTVAAPPDPVMTTFSIISNAPEGIATYQWKMRPVGVSVYLNQTTTPQFTPARIANGISSGKYYIQCDVTTQYGRTATTPAIFVEIINGI